MSRGITAWGFRIILSLPHLKTLEARIYGTGPRQDGTTIGLRCLTARERAELTVMEHKHSPRFLILAEESRKRVRQTTVDEVKGRLERGDRFVLVDVREDNEWATDHLPRAVHLGKIGRASC